MLSRRVLAALAAMIVLLAACGKQDADVASDRVVASPAGSPTPSGSPPGSSDETATPRGEGTPRATRGTDGARSTVAPSAAANLAAARIKLTRVASMSQPVAMALRANDSAFYLAEKTGKVRPLRSGDVGGPVLDVSSEISTGNEQGLLGLAFRPDGKKLYVNFTSRTGEGDAGDTVIREYVFSNGKATDPRDVLRIPQPYSNHNGGNIAFGPDGYLYIGMGDGGTGGDRHDNAQDLDSLLGKMLRIDPDPSGSAAYSSPKDNPFVGRAGADEIWAYGLRNPWRFSFDHDTDALWIGDVGQNAWEEIDFAPAGGDGGDNYGWDRMEGTHRHEGSAPSNHHGPIYEYSHDGGNCSVTGGYVYRGSKIANLRGAYVFADHCVGRLRGFVENGGRAQNHRFLGPQVGSPTSFGQARNGDLYVLSRDGGVYRIDPA